MGSSTSHLVFSESSSSSKSSSSASAGSKLSRTKRKLSQMFCGVFTPKSTFQVEDCPEISSVSSTKSLAPIDCPQNPVLESSSVFTSEIGDTISIHENCEFSDRSSSMIEEAFLESNPLNVQTSRDLEPLPHQPVQEDVTSEETAFVYPSVDQLNSALVGFNGSDLRSLSIVSDSLQRFRFPGDDDDAHVTTTSSSGLLVSDSDQDFTSGDLLRLDLVSISSNALSGIIAEANSDESRRNSLRLFWDALSRRSLRRHSDAPAFVFATGLGEDLRSHDRWLFDFSGDFHYYGAGREVDSFSSRLHRRNERRWLLRSEVSERTESINEGALEPILCSSGLHPDGSCSCNSFFTAEESSSLASISRIIMLAEALFEVLDEIHLQSLSLSLSTLSLPAPESVVDAFPLKYHKKIKNAENDSSDVRQCYICLSDYEEGDELRVLPCNHEFHVPCVDKWLKEVNRVCPLCRHDVCEGSGDCSVPNPEV